MKNMKRKTGLVILPLNKENNRDKDKDEEERVNKLFYISQHQKYLSPARLSGAELCQNWLAGIGKESRVTSKLHLRHRCDVEFREANGEILRSQYCVELKHFVIPFCLD